MYSFLLGPRCGIASKLSLSRPSTPTSQRWVDVPLLDSLSGRPRPLRRHISTRRIKRRKWNSCFALLEDGRLTLARCRAATPKDFKLECVTLQKNEKRCLLRLLVGGSPTDGEELRVPADEFDGWLAALRAHQLSRRRPLSADSHDSQTRSVVGADAKAAARPQWGSAAAAKYKQAKKKMVALHEAVSALAPKREDLAKDVKQRLTQNRIDSCLNRLEALEFLYRAACDAFTDSLAAQRALPVATMHKPNAAPPSPVPARKSKKPEAPRTHKPKRRRPLKRARPTAHDASESASETEDDDVPRAPLKSELVKVTAKPRTTTTSVRHHAPATIQPKETPVTPAPAPVKECPKESPVTPAPAPVKESQPKEPLVKRRTCLPAKATGTGEVTIGMLMSAKRKGETPVQLFEPLSVLQGLCQDLDHAELLDQAAAERDPVRRMAYVAAFAISAYASAPNRTRKPFTPLEGETYEFDRRDDRGWRFLAEKVAHKPDIYACHADADKWQWWQTAQFSVDLIKAMFRADLEVLSEVRVGASLSGCGEDYSWTKVLTVVHGAKGPEAQRYLSHHGRMEVECSSGLCCVIDFGPRNETGAGLTARIELDGKTLLTLDGDWRIGLRAGADSFLFSQKHADCGAEYYRFSRLAVELNEPADALGVAPTDSRLRQDVRELERGNLPEAQQLKGALEAEVRRRREAGERALPLWFAPDDADDTQWRTNNKYWPAKLSHFKGVSFPPLRFTGP